MKLDDEKFKNAEYDRFIDFMGQMYLKYGSMYQKLTTQKILELIPSCIVGIGKGKHSHIRK